MTSDTACVHHWVIEAPHGAPTVSSICKRCGETKELSAGFDETMFYGNKGGKRGAQARWGRIPLDKKSLPTRVQ